MMALLAFTWKAWPVVVSTELVVSDRNCDQCSAWCFLLISWISFCGLLWHSLLFLCLAHALKGIPPLILMQSRILLNYSTTVSV